MEREDRIGAWVSGIAHVALILWLLLGGVLFRASDREPVEAVQIGTMTESDFQALAAATRGPGPVGDGAMRPPAAVARPEAPAEAPAPLQTAPSQTAPGAGLPVLPTPAPAPVLPDSGPATDTPPAPTPDPISPLALDRSRSPNPRPDGLVEAARARAEAARLDTLAAQREAEAAEAQAEAEAQAALAEAQAQAQAQAEAEAQAQAEARALEQERQAAAQRAEAEARAAELARQAEADRIAEAQRLEEQRLREEAERLEAERREAERREAERREAEARELELQRELERIAEAARQIESEQIDDTRPADDIFPSLPDLDPDAEIVDDTLSRALAEAMTDRADDGPFDDLADPDASGEFTDPDAIEDPDLPRGPRASGVPDDELTHSLDTARSDRIDPIPDDQLTSAMETVLANTPLTPSRIAELTSDAPVLSSHELGVLMTHIGECWNINMLSLDAQDTVISVEVRLDRAGVPLPDSLHLIDWQGGSEVAAQNAFEVAARAIRACGEEGLDLPPEKYDRWKRLILDFDPRQMATHGG